MPLKKILKYNRGLIMLIVIIILGCANSADREVEDIVVNQPPKAIDQALIRLSPAFKWTPQAGSFPRCLETNGDTRQVASKDWTSGFYPGVLWYAYEYTGNDAYKTLAEQWTALMEEQKTNNGTHDMGFKMNCSYGNGYRLTNNSAFKTILLESAKTLSTRFNPVVGCTRSWDFNADIWQFPVIIDNMMNLELLFEATQLSGDSTYYKMAYQHAMTTLENHYRPDNSSYHVVDYNPKTGEVVKKFTHQGYADESIWARGQAWGLYGFTMAYRFTGEKKFLQKAEDIYAFIFSHPDMPDDLIPYWDYSAPDRSDRPRDVSAATVTASALYELYGMTQNASMLEKANAIMDVLNTDAYMTPKSAENVFILDHSTGNMPKLDELDVPIIYADYYYMEALLRRKAIEE